MIETIFQYQTKRTISINELQTADYKEIDFKWADPAERNFLSNRDLWGDSFWSPSYFIATTGNVSIDVLKEYVENQRSKKINED